MGCKVGIYNLHMKAMGGGERLTLVLAEHLSSMHYVTLFCAEPLDIPLFQHFFEVDLSRVTVIPLNQPGPSFHIATKVPGVRGPALSLHHFNELKKQNLDIFINNSYASRLRCPATHGIFMCMFPHTTSHLPVENAARRIKSTVVEQIEKRLNGSSTSVLDSYSRVVAISQYSADWVQRMWQRRAQTIWPPCDDMGPPASKGKIILNVGRFIPGAADDERHHKGQEILLDVFTRMTDLHRDGWELHLVGSVGSDAVSEEYVRTLERQAIGSPVVFHTNAKRDEVRDLYRRAPIYWHATGYGFDIERQPAKQEHFGIATVEAMSAGAVPVVYASGGQKEIVTNEVDGIWWNDVQELMDQTRRLAYERTLRCDLSAWAIASSKRFGRDVFAAKLDQLIAEVLADRIVRSELTR